MDNNNTQPTHWQIDKRVPVALVFAIFLQSATAVWWARGQQEGLENLSKQYQQQNTRISAVESRLNNQDVQVSVTLNRLDNLTSNLQRLREDVRETNNLLREYLTNEKENK